MIRDRIVVGIHDAKFSESLQLDADLTLEKAIMQVRQRAGVKKLQPILCGAAQPIGQVKAIHKKDRRSQKTLKCKAESQSSGCGRCGYFMKHTFTETKKEMESDVKVFVDAVIQAFPATEMRLNTIIKNQKANPICVKLIQYCETEWPEKKDLPPELAHTAQKEKILQWLESCS